LLDGKTVRAQCYQKDRYGRDICDILLAHPTASAEMARQGLAWAFTPNGGRYLCDRSFVQKQAAAQAKKVGLWSDKSPVAPWEWRKLWQKRQCS